MWLTRSMMRRSGLRLGPSLRAFSSVGDQSARERAIAAAQDTVKAGFDGVSYGTSLVVARGVQRLGGCGRGHFVGAAQDVVEPGAQEPEPRAAGGVFVCGTVEGLRRSQCFLCSHVCHQSSL